MCRYTPSSIVAAILFILYEQKYPRDLILTDMATSCGTRMNRPIIRDVDNQLRRRQVRGNLDAWKLCRDCSDCGSSSPARTASGVSHFRASFLGKVGYIWCLHNRVVHGTVVSEHTTGTRSTQCVCMECCYLGCASL